MIYIVQSGDTLYAIAQRFNTTIHSLLSLNPQITNPDLIYPGQLLNIPGSVTYCPLLRLGDRGSGVSRLQLLLSFARFNPGPIDGIFGPMTQNALIEFQRSQKEFEVSGIADQETWIALGAECRPRSAITTYIIRPGDTLFIISVRFNVSIDSILNLNPQITDPRALVVGQIIRIPANI